MDKSILVFGLGFLQESLIRQCKERGLKTIGIDPLISPYCKDYVDEFVQVAGDDYNKTLEVAKKFNVSGIITTATDKPLVMMARIAQALCLPFFSLDTAIWSTDKFQMKNRFQKYGIPCAKGKLISSVDDAKDLSFPVIIKPRDNSGSRGVKLCRTLKELESSISEAFQYSHLDSILVEEYIEGNEYSIESLHFNGQTEVIQFTEKRTTPFPYNVELGHKQPANLTEEQRNKIRCIVDSIGKCLKFDNCPSHTELKVNERGIFVIETSPRLGGDFITSTLTPLSTGINIEDQLISISLGLPLDFGGERINEASGVCFFSFKEGTIVKIDSQVENVKSWPGVCGFDLNLKEGDKVNRITSSLNRYGQFIVRAKTREEVDDLIDCYERRIIEMVEII